MYFGIDPGENGAIVWLLREKNWFSVDWIPTKGTEGYTKVEGIDPKMVTAFVERERVSGMMSPTAAGTFMTGYGFCLGVLHCLGYRTVLVDPQVWLRTLPIEPFKPAANVPMAKLRALRKKHYGAQIRELWGGLEGVPEYAVDAHGILLAGLMTLCGTSLSPSSSPSSPSSKSCGKSRRQ